MAAKAKSAAIKRDTFYLADEAHHASGGGTLLAGLAVE